MRMSWTIVPMSTGFDVESWKQPVPSPSDYGLLFWKRSERVQDAPPGMMMWDSKSTWLILSTLFSKTVHSRPWQDHYICWGEAKGNENESSDIPRWKMLRILSWKSRGYYWIWAMCLLQSRCWLLHVLRVYDQECNKFTVCGSCWKKYSIQCLYSNHPLIHPTPAATTKPLPNGWHKETIRREPIVM